MDTELKLRLAWSATNYAMTTLERLYLKDGQWESDEKRDWFYKLLDVACEMSEREAELLSASESTSSESTPSELTPRKSYRRSGTLDLHSPNGEEYALRQSHPLYAAWEDA